MESFGDRLFAAVRQKETPAVVGIDPRADLLPPGLVERHRLGSGASTRVWARVVEEFCSRVLEIVAPLVPVVKFQSAFFEVHGAPGVASLGVLLRKARRLGLVTILDAKRGDIGNTSEAYAEAAFGKFAESSVLGDAADALTVSPYMGRDSLEPFLKFAREAGRGLFVLVRTSNPGSRDLQHLADAQSSQTIYRHVAAWVREWSDQTRCQFGYGSVGAVVNNSRGILFPKMEGDAATPGAWEAAVEATVKRMIDDLAEHTPAGRLRTP